MLVVEAAIVSCFWTGITAISTDRSVQIPRMISQSIHWQRLEAFVAEINHSGCPTPV